MVKRFIWLVLATVFFALQMFAGSANAAQQEDEAIRTIPRNEQGDTLVLTPKQIKIGQRQFNFACATCHASGITRTDPNIDLRQKTLALATPPRDSVEALVDYMKDPTTYDGGRSIAELHPSTQSADTSPK